MATAADWVRQDNVDDAANTMIGSGKATLRNITTYQVAKELNASPNVSIYTKFNDWKARKLEDEHETKADLPAGMASALSTILDQQAKTTLDLCIDMVRSIAKTMEASLNLRLAGYIEEIDANRASISEIINRWQETEEQVKLLSIEKDALTQEIDSVRSERSELVGVNKALQSVIEGFRQASGTSSNGIN